MIARRVDTVIAVVAAATTASVVVALVDLLGPPNAPAARATAVARTMVDLAPVTRLAPFGRARSTPADTRGLVLRGVMLADAAASSTALIAAGGGRALPYRVGDALPGGAVVDAIEYDLVTLRADDSVVTLGFPVADRRPHLPDAGASL